MFDREGDDGKFVSVTVKATDQGEPSLEGVCSFTVEITDVNDNPPLFDRQVRTFNHTPEGNRLANCSVCRCRQMPGSTMHSGTTSSVNALCPDAHKFERVPCSAFSELRFEFRYLLDQDTYIVIYRFSIYARSLCRAQQVGQVHNLQSPQYKPISKTNLMNYGLGPLLL